MMSDGQRSKLVSEPPLAAPGDEHARLVEADQRFQVALAQAIAAAAPPSSVISSRRFS
jgi:hypothetical protein